MTRSSQPEPATTGPVHQEKWTQSHDDCSSWLVPQRVDELNDTVTLSAEEDVLNHSDIV